MNWLLRRLGEPSTWRGIVLLATGLGITMEPEKMDAIVAVGLAVVGLINVCRRESRKTIPGGEFNPRAEVRRAEPANKPSRRVGPNKG